MKHFAQLCMLIFAFFCTTQTLKSESIGKADPATVSTPAVHPGNFDKAELAKKYNLAEGKEIYTNSCSACHTIGLVAAPKIKVATPAGKAEPAKGSTPAAHPGNIDKAELAKKYNLAEGKEIYTNSCSACHGIGLLAAPKFCDITAWKPRMANGMDTLIKHTVEGFNGMPSKGGIDTLTLDQAANAVAYMVDQCLF